MQNNGHDAVIQDQFKLHTAPFLEQHGRGKYPLVEVIAECVAARREDGAVRVTYPVMVLTWEKR